MGRDKRYCNPGTGATFKTELRTKTAFPRQYTLKETRSPKDKFNLKSSSAIFFFFSEQSTVKTKMLCLASSRQLRNFKQKTKNTLNLNDREVILTRHSFVYSKLFHGDKGYIRHWKADSQQGRHTPSSLRLHRPADQLDREVGNSKSRAECQEKGMAF